MRSFVRLAAVAAIVLAADRLAAQVATPDPDVRGPARRAAGAAAEALGAPGVENRIENRQQRREARREIAEADRWRYRWHNGEWWYYTPENRWMYYRDNNWSDYDANTWAPRRYSAGYRGPAVETRTYYYDRRGVFRRPYRVYYNNPPARSGVEIRAGVGGADVEVDVNRSGDAGADVKVEGKTGAPPAPPVQADAPPMHQPIRTPAPGPVPRTPEPLPQP
jgi:hypothetical protein